MQLAYALRRTCIDTRQYKGNNTLDLRIKRGWGGAKLQPLTRFSLHTETPSGNKKLREMGSYLSFACESLERFVAA